MRFRVHKKGERKTVTKFAWFPICISGEIRWLEKVTYIAQWIPNSYGKYHWHKESFLYE